MSQGTFPDHLNPVEEDPRGREAGVFAINAAVRLLCAEHHVGEASAYTILVQASVDSRSSVRAAAAQIVEASRASVKPKR